MANKNICDVDLLQSMSKNTNVIVDENGKVNKLNLYNEFDNVNKSIDTVNDNIAQISNPNLLINSDFRNPINQRGQTSYTLDASARKYTIDRWCSANAIKVVLEDDGIHIYNTGSQTYGYLLQYIETPLIVGEKYTISAKINGVIRSHTFIAGEGFNMAVPYFTYDPASDSLAYDRIGLRIEDSYLVEYIKLEQGSIATPFVPRPYGEELALCKRYYRCMHAAWLNLVNCIVTSSTNLKYQLPFEMRVLPTVTFSHPSWTIGDMATANKNVTITSMEVIQYFLDITISSGHGLTKGQVCTLTVGGSESTAGLEFDAEIY